MQIFELELHDALRPDWLGEQAVRMPVPRIIEKALDGEVLGYLLNGKKRYPAIIKRGEEIIFNFDPEEVIDFIINERYYAAKRPVYTHLPRGFTGAIPARMRIAIKKLINGAGYFDQSSSSFPAWPIETSVELLRQILIKARGTAGRNLPEPCWPMGKKFALCFTHDVDSAQGQGNIEKTMRPEERCGVTSTWFIVGKRYALDFNILDELKKKGNEIGLHGYNHDNRTAFLRPQEIETRIRRCSALIERYGIKGFRSPSLYRSRNLFDVLSKFFLYDSSVPDTAKLSPQPWTNGAGTVFPFMKGKLCEVPLTVPLDSSLIFLGYKPAQILDIWLKKIDWIRRVGGLAVVTTHPEPHLSARAEMLDVYSELINWVKNQKDAWIANLADVAQYWHSRINNE